MSLIKPHTLSGFMELLPEPQSQMDAILNSLRKTYELYGFTALDTPVMEAADVLLAKSGGDTEKQIFRLQKGDTDYALRFDLTVPLAKYVSINYGQLAFPFRRYQIAKVYRGERAQRGRFREFYQADIDIIGDETLDPVNEAEIPAIICDAFRRLGLTRFIIRINNRKVLNGLFDYYDLSENASGIMQTIDKLEKIGHDKTAELLTTEFSVSPDTASQLLSVIESGDPYSLRGKNPILDEGLDELEKVTSLLKNFGVDDEHWELDLTIARGLDYYTGTVYETKLLDYPEVGSVCSGGRYDNLAEYYTNKKLPGVGISIGVTRLFFILQDQGLLNPESVVPPCSALVIPMDDSTYSYGASVATALRNAGIRTQVYSENKKIKAKFSYADKLHIPYALVIGSDEKDKNLVTLKDLRTGKQNSLSAEDAINIIKEGLEKSSSPIKEIK